jgi:hypothetical protein
VTLEPGKVDEADARTALEEAEKAISRAEAVVVFPYDADLHYFQVAQAMCAAPFDGVAALRVSLESREIDSEAIEEAALALVQSSAFFVGSTH